jgi:hypothetical protein
MGVCVASQTLIIIINISITIIRCEQKTLQPCPVAMIESKAVRIQFKGHRRVAQVRQPLSSVQVTTFSQRWSGRTQQPFFLQAGRSPSPHAVWLHLPKKAGQATMKVVALNLDFMPVNDRMSQKSKIRVRVRGGVSQSSPVRSQEYHGRFWTRGCLIFRLFPGGAQAFPINVLE